jgi:hypothetical protein
VTFFLVTFRGPALFCKTPPNLEVIPGQPLPALAH